MLRRSAKPKPTNGPSIFAVLQPYKPMMALLVLVAVTINVLTLVVPKLTARAIDHYILQIGDINQIAIWFSLVVVAIFMLTYLQSVMQTYASERVGKDLRQSLADTISKQSYSNIRALTPAKLLTNLTSDIDSIKLFVAQAIVSIVASVVTIIGASILLLLINWKLALAVLTILPIIGGTFSFVLKRVRKLFFESRGVIDWLNKVINESILGAALIRILNSQQPEHLKFQQANLKAKNLGLQILKLFSAMIPMITFVAAMATVIILSLGGHFVIAGSMTLGDFAAFNSYLTALIFPIFVIGFMSGIIAQATASYGRVLDVLKATVQPDTGTYAQPLTGQISLQGVTLMHEHKPILKDVSLEIAAHSKTAIIGPTAAGKTQLLYALTGLIEPTSGDIRFDDHALTDYAKASLHKQIGFVFQDSILFNLSLRANIAFSDTVDDAALQKAITAAELSDFIQALPAGLDTIVSERGSSLSGGQKQRIMLARALALEPSILLLDDFTARVDTKTERKILQNISTYYPNLTLISVTQKIAAVEHYDQIVLLMEGEILATGTHNQLLHSSPEYAQIFASQQSTHAYE